MSCHFQKVLKTVSGDIKGEMKETMREEVSVEIKCSFCILQTSPLQNTLCDSTLK